jgi:hypothetical protein
MGLTHVGTSEKKTMTYVIKEEDAKGRNVLKPWEVKSIDALRYM